MNFLMMCPNEELIDIVFPSPTGVTYYELCLHRGYYVKNHGSEFPSPTGVTYYELEISAIVTTEKYR